MLQLGNNLHEETRDNLHKILEMGSYVKKSSDKNLTDKSYCRSVTWYPKGRMSTVVIVR